MGEPRDGAGGRKMTMRKPAKNSLKGKREPEQPTWFQEKDYAYLRIDAVGWHQELLRLYDLNLGLVGVAAERGTHTPRRRLDSSGQAKKAFGLNLTGCRR